MSLPDAGIVDGLHATARGSSLAEEGNNVANEEGEEERDKAPRAAKLVVSGDRTPRQMAYTREIVFLVLAFAAVCVRFSP